MAISSRTSGKPAHREATGSLRSGADQESEFKTALDVLETCLATPIVAGDLAEWLADVRRAWGEAAAQIHFHVKHLHPRQYEEIAKQAPELLPRIESLKIEDAAIEEERGKLNERMVRMATRAPQLEPDEEKAKTHMKSLSDDTIALIVRVRKQSVAVQTWFIEAFNRDSGAVD